MRLVAVAWTPDGTVEGIERSDRTWLVAVQFHPEDLVGAHAPSDRLPAADEDAQPEIVAFGALRLLDGAFAHVDRERYRAHRKSVGLIGARAPRGGDETLGEIGDGGLIEKR